MSVYADSIDDNDPQVLYSIGWQLITQDSSWTGTMHSTTNINGAWARVRFTGSRVAVVCTIATGSGSLVLGSIGLDSGPAVNVSHVPTPPVQWQTVLWDSGPLPFESHLLVITNTGNHANFRLDQIDYDPTNGNSTSSSAHPPASTTSVTTTTVVDQAEPTSVVVSTTSSSPSSGSLSSTNVTVSTQSIFGIPSASATQSLSSSSSSSAAGTATAGSDLNSGVGSSTPSTKFPTASIVAGILGALMAILLVAGLVYFIRRRRNRARYLDNSVSTSFSPGRRGAAARSTISTPFNLAMTSAEMSTSDLVPVRTASYSDAYNSFGHSGPTQEGSYTRRSASPMPTDANSSASDSGSGLRHSIPSSSMYVPEESHAVSGRMSRPTQQQSVGRGGLWVGSKHAEAFGQDPQLMDTSTSEYGGTSRTIFQDAPLAYTGRVSSFLNPSLGGGVER